MNRIKKIFFKFFLASIVFLMPVFVLAVNDFSFDADVYFSIKTVDTNTDVTVTGKNGGVVTAITTDVNYLDITLDNGSAVTFTVPSGRYFVVSKQSGTNNYAISPSCITNSVTLSATGNVVLRLTVKTTPPTCADSGGGGGGGGGGLIPSTIIGSVSINNGAISTLSTNVSINLAWNNATEVRLSENNQFLGVNWRPVVSVLPWTFSNTSPGSKTIYAQFKNSSGISTIYSYTISLVGEVPIEPPEETEPKFCIIDQSKLTFDLYIVNPDGTERHMNANYTRTTQIAPGVLRVGFEDSGSDFDYNDLVLEVDTSRNGFVTIRSVALDAGWHHKLRMILFYEGIRKKDFLLWNDSHQSVGQSKVIDLNLVAGDLCLADSPFQKIDVEIQNYKPIDVTEPTKLLPIGFTENKGCLSSRIFVTRMSLNSSASQEIRDLQDVLKCLGYFPTDQGSTAIFGAVTELSVKKFQEYHGLVTSGITDEATLRKINDLLRPIVLPNYTFTRNITMGDSGADVSALQQFLVDKNIGPSAVALRDFGVTGYFADLTKAALIEFQLTVALPADGTLNDATINYLNNLGKTVVVKGSDAPILEGDVIKTPTNNAVYYVSNGRKRLMVNRGTYSSWSGFVGDSNNNFGNLRIVSQSNFDSIPFGPNITVRPGTDLIKFNDSEDIFAVGIDAKLYKLASGVKERLYSLTKTVIITNSFRADYYNNGNPVAILYNDSIYPSGTLIKSAESNDVYYWDGVSRRLVSGDAFINNHFKNEWVKTVTDVSPYGTLGLPIVSSEILNGI
jgi:peptidoglycan hydrolase-like protein with peptidoglycan-binding domain